MAKPALGSPERTIARLNKRVVDLPESWQFLLPLAETVGCEIVAVWSVAALQRGRAPSGVWSHGMRVWAVASSDPADHVLHEIAHAAVARLNGLTAEVNFGCDTDTREALAMELLVCDMQVLWCLKNIDTKAAVRVAYALNYIDSTASIVDSMRRSVTAWKQVGVDIEITDTEIEQFGLRWWQEVCERDGYDDAPGLEYAAKDLKWEVPSDWVDTQPDPYAQK